MPRLRPAVVLSLAALLAVGCGPHIRKPNPFDPGNAAQQQYNAIFFDPYPSPNLGPEIVGGRPREYQVPVPEVVDGRLLQPQRTNAVVTPPPVFGQ